MKTDDEGYSLTKKVRTVSSLGILLDGYNLSVIAVALVPLTRVFHLGAAATGLLASAMLLGSIVGGLVGGFSADRWGRKTLLIWDLIIFMIFSIVSMVLYNYTWLVVARFVVGLAVGADYAIAPTYLAEFVSRQTRGYQLGYVWLAWSVGAVLSFGFGAILVAWLPSSLSWRILFGLALIPALIGLLMRRQLPESPHWLKFGGRASATGRDVKASSGLGRAWLLALVPWFLMDFSTYGLGLLLPLLLKSDGFAGNTGAIIGTGLAAFMGGLGSVWAMMRLDRFGRIFLQVRGFLFTGGGLWILASLLWMNYRVFLVLLAGLMVVNLFNGSGPGTTCGIIPAEVFPTPMRATALGVSTATSRVGAIAGVFILEFLQVRYGLGAVLAAAGTASLIGAVLSWIWRIEPNQATLPDSPGDATALVP